MAVTARILSCIAVLAASVPLAASAQLGKIWPAEVPPGTPPPTAARLQRTLDEYNEECDPSRYRSPRDMPRICRSEPEREEDRDKFEDTCPIHDKKKGWTRICVPTVLGGIARVENLIISPPYGVLIVPSGSTPAMATIIADEDLLGSGGSFQVTGGAIVGGSLKIVAEEEVGLAVGAIALAGDLQVESPKIVLGEAHDPDLDLPLKDLPLPGFGIVYAGGHVEVKADDVEVRAAYRLHGGTLEVTAKSLVVAPGGRVDADGGAGGPGTLTAGWGGSHGGFGGAPDAYCPNCQLDYLGNTIWNTMKSPARGDPTRPATGGERGGPVDGNPGTAGGGLIRMTLDKLELESEGDERAVLSADGASTLFDGSAAGDSAGGSGGGIDLTVKTLTGGGVIRANGATSCREIDPIGESCLDHGEGGAGGGGRIAIRYENRDGWSGAVTAWGGMQGPRTTDTNMYLTYGRGKSGGAGTVFWRAASEPESAGELVIAGPPVDPAIWPEGMDAYQMTIQGWGATPILPSFATPDRKLIVTGAAFAVVDGGDALTFKSLEVSGGAVLGLEGCDDPWGCDDRHALALTGETITVGPGSRIDLIGRGGAGGADVADPDVPPERLDANAPAVAAADGKSIAGSTRFAGGSHGGEGAVSLAFAEDGRPNATYGSPTDPRDFGRGGAGLPYENHYGLPGGGLLTITAGHLTVDGVVTVSGASTPYDVGQGGGGAGGGMKLVVDRLAGSGTIEANGGIGCPPPPDASDECLDVVGGSGGGGRIAIVYGERAEWAGEVRARGGRVTTDDPWYFGERLNAMSGGAGTIYWRAKDAPEAAGTLVIDNGSDDPTMWPQSADAWQIGIGRWAATPVSADFFTPQRRVEIRGDATFVASQSRDLVAGALTLEDGAILGLARCERAIGCDGPHELTLVAHAIAIGPRARVDVSGRGGKGVEFADGAAAPAIPAASGEVVPGSVGESGGSYGGLGASVAESATPNPTFGDPDAVADFGRGGGAGLSGRGLPGGGFLFIRAGTLALDGALAATGAPGSGARDEFARDLWEVGPGGGGSGGGIVLQVAKLTGSGAIRVNGAHVIDRIYCTSYAPGGGGRFLGITTDRTGWTGTADAAGGTCSDEHVRGVSAGDGSVRWRTEEVVPPPPPPGGGDEVEDLPARRGGGCASAGLGNGASLLLAVLLLAGHRTAARRGRATPSRFERTPGTFPG